MTGWIGISLGDVTGVGPEVALKAVAAEAASDDTKYLFIGDAGHLQAALVRSGLNLPVQPYTEGHAVGRFYALVYHVPIAALQTSHQQCGVVGVVFHKQQIQWSAHAPSPC